MSFQERHKIIKIGEIFCLAMNKFVTLSLTLSCVLEEILLSQNSVIFIFQSDTLIEVKDISNFYISNLSLLKTTLFFDKIEEISSDQILFFSLKKIKLKGFSNFYIREVKLKEISNLVKGIDALLNGIIASSGISELLNESKESNDSFNNDTKTQKKAHY